MSTGAYCWMSGESGSFYLSKHHGPQTIRATPWSLIHRTTGNERFTAIYDYWQVYVRNNDNWSPTPVPTSPHRESNTTRNKRLTAFTSACAASCDILNWPSTVVLALEPDVSVRLLGTYDNIVAIVFVLTAQVRGLILKYTTDDWRKLRAIKSW